MRLFKGWFNKVGQLLSRERAVNDELFDELEELLVQADVSIYTTTTLVDDLRRRARKEGWKDPEQVRQELQAGLLNILRAENGTELNLSAEKPNVYLVVGVNGVGKTTTIAKLANRFKTKGQRVLLSAADTFRAAAIDQLEIWADRVGVDIVKHRPGADPSAVVFDSLQAAKARGVDVVIVDTAGRLHTRSNLMEELKKIARVVERELGRKPEETLLVLDATTGQNAVNQAREFLSVAGVSGIALTKLDGTAKGGIIITIKDELGVPIKLIGTGEQMEDLVDFNSQEFVEALFPEQANEQK